MSEGGREPEEIVSYRPYLICITGFTQSVSESSEEEETDMQSAACIRWDVMFWEQRPLRCKIVFGMEVEVGVRSAHMECMPVVDACGFLLIGKGPQ